MDPLVFGGGERFIQLARMRREGNKVTQTRLPQKRKEGVLCSGGVWGGGVRELRDGSDALVPGNIFPCQVPCGPAAASSCV